MLEKLTEAHLRCVYKNCIKLFPGGGVDSDHIAVPAAAAAAYDIDTTKIITNLNPRTQA